MTTRARALAVAVVVFAESAAGAVSGPKRDKVLALAPKLVAADHAERERAGSEILRVGTKAIEPLLELSRKANGDLAFEIGKVLSRFGPDQIEEIAAAANRQYPYGQPQAWRVAVGAVAAMGEPALPKLAELFTRENQLHRARFFADAVLSKMGPIAVPTLIGFLKHPHQGVRHDAVTTLAGLADPRSADALLEGLTSPDHGVRMYSANGLGKMADRRAIDPLLALLKDPIAGVREHAAVALGKMYEPRFAGPILELAKSDPQPTVRQTAAYVLLDHSRDQRVLREAEKYKIDHLPTGADRLRRRFLIIDVVSGLALTVLALIGVRFGVGGRIAACCAAAVIGFWGGPLGIAIVTALASSLAVVLLGRTPTDEKRGRGSYWWTLCAVIVSMILGVAFHGVLLSGRAGY